MNKKELAIGVFDSGLGGLTVLKAINTLLPNENLIYFGDNLNIPYGNKSVERIKELTIKNLDYIFNQNIKMLVIACNTVSSFYLDDEIQKKYSIPVIEVIRPCAREAISRTKTKSVAVIGTENTIRKGQYEKIMKENNIKVWSKETELLVPFLEYGLKNKKIVELTLMEYLEKMPNDADVLILGCTHYPFFMKEFKNVLLPEIELLDASSPTAKQIEKSLKEENLFNSFSKKGFVDITFSKESKKVKNKVSELFKDFSFNIKK